MQQAKQEPEVRYSQAPLRLQYGKVSRTGPPPGYEPRKTCHVKVLSSLSDKFADNDLVTITFPPMSDPDGSTQCVMYGETLRKVTSLPGFPERRMKPSPNIVEVRGSPGRGLGLFATTNIPVGQLLVSERPLFLEPGMLLAHPEDLPSYAGYSMEEMMQIQMYEWEKELEVAMKMMPAGMRDKYFKLANSHTEDGSGPILGISRTNSFSGKMLHTHQSGYTFEHSAVGDVLSRINHSCCPNANVDFHTASFSLELRAVRNIAAGEEISVRYCTPTMPFEQRKESLAPYGFVCACAACSDPAKSDPIRAAFRAAPVPLLDGSVDPILAVRAICALQSAGLEGTTKYLFYHVAAMQGFLNQGEHKKGREYLALAVALDAAVNGRKSLEITAGLGSKTASSVKLLPNIARLRIGNTAST